MLFRKKASSYPVTRHLNAILKRAVNPPVAPWPVFRSCFILYTTKSVGGLFH